MTDAVEPRSSRWSAFPRWARVALVVVAVIVIALIAFVVIRVATRVPPIPLGVTETHELRLGSCLADDARDAAEYTVVNCGDAHPQQVFAAADLSMNDSVYAAVEPALATFGDQVCRRFLEYRLGLLDDLVTFDLTAYAIAVPAADSYAAGDTVALCAVASADGSPLTSDLYRPAP